MIHLKFAPPPVNLYNTRVSECKSVKRAFTLAEVTITVAILGLVAAIIVPNLIRREIYNTKRIKIKKALAAYDRAVNNMVIENNLRSENELNTWAAGPNNTCQNAKNYFKIVETDRNDPCNFKTSDGLWWKLEGTSNKTNSRIPGVNKVRVSFKNERIDGCQKSVDNCIKGYADSPGNNEAFYFVSNFDDNGSLRVSDISYGFSEGKTIQFLTTSKVYAFINKKKMEDYFKICKNNKDRNCIKHSAGQWYFVDENGGKPYVTNCKEIDDKTPVTCDFSKTGGNWKGLESITGNFGAGCGGTCNTDNFTLSGSYGCDSIGDLCGETSMVFKYKDITNAPDVILDENNVPIFKYAKDIPFLNNNGFTLQTAQHIYYDCDPPKYNISSCSIPGINTKYKSGTLQYTFKNSSGDAIMVRYNEYTKTYDMWSTSPYSGTYNGWVSTGGCSCGTNWTGCTCSCSGGETYNKACHWNDNN